MFPWYVRGFLVSAPGDDLQWFSIDLNNHASSSDLDISGLTTAATS